MAEFRRMEEERERERLEAREQEERMKREREAAAQAAQKRELEEAEAAMAQEQEWLNNERLRQEALFKERNAPREVIQTEDFSYGLEDGMSAKIKKFRQQVGGGCGRRLAVGWLAVGGDGAGGRVGRCRGAVDGRGASTGRRSRWDRGGRAREATR